MRTKAEKDAINARRRERYKTDPVYRAKQIKAAKEYAAKCRECKICHEHMKEYQREYRKNRLVNDPEFKKRVLAINIKATKMPKLKDKIKISVKKYQSKPEVKARRNQLRKERRKRSKIK